MKETGIIMSGDHPLKCLDGTKTMTRRVIVPQPFNQALIPLLVTPNTWGWFKDGGRDLPEGRLFKCPYGQVGDRLWVREKYALKPQYDLLSATEVVELYGIRKDIYYETLTECFWTGKTRPSIHMPRWASRGLFEILPGLRPERLQEITEEDAEAEGIVIEKGDYYRTCKGKFHQLWDSLNAKRGYGWEVNPWVWVIGFSFIGARLK